MLRHSIILALFVVILGSCTRENKTSQKQRVTIGLSSHIASFDPIHATDDPTTQLSNLFYQPLLSVKQEAQEWPKTEAEALNELPVVSQDGMELRLQIKSGLKFEASTELDMKGREANSKDLAVTILRNADRRLNARYSELVEEIVGVKEWWSGPKNLDQLPPGLKILDNSTLVIRLKKASPNWWYNLSLVNFSLVPAEAFGKQLSRPAGTGNYSLKSTADNQIILAKKFGVGPEEISYIILGNQLEEAKTLLKELKIDAVPVNSDQATFWFDGTALKKEYKDVQLQTFYGATSQYVAFLFNPSLKTELSKKLHARLSQNLDRAFLSLFLGSLLSPCTSLYRCDAELPPMQKYAGKEILKVRVILSDLHQDASTRDAITRAFKDAGIDVSFVDGNVFEKNGWKADIALIDVNMATYDPTDLLSLGHASSNLSKKMFESLSLTKPSTHALESLAVWVRDEASIVAISRRRAAVVTNDRVKKASFNIQGWLDPRTLEFGGK